MIEIGNFRKGPHIPSVESDSNSLVNTPNQECVGLDDKMNFLLHRPHKVEDIMEEPRQVIDKRGAQSLNP